MDDDELNDKMRRAQERLKGLDNHVADLRKRSVEHDAVSKGKLPPEQTAAYLEKVKDLEAKRRELLERQMDVGEKLQRAATTNGTLNQHRHGGTPRPEREHNRRELVDRLRREEGAARKRLAAYKGGSGWNEADAATRPRWTARMPTRRKRPWRPSASASASASQRSAGATWRMSPRMTGAAAGAAAAAAAVRRRATTPCASRTSTPAE